MMKFREALKNDDITDQIVLSDEDKNAFMNMVAKEISKHQNLVGSQIYCQILRLFDELV